MHILLAMCSLEPCAHECVARYTELMWIAAGLLWNGLFPLPPIWCMCRCLLCQIRLQRLLLYSNQLWWLLLSIGKSCSILIPSNQTVLPVVSDCTCNALLMHECIWCVAAANSVLQCLHLSLLSIQSCPRLGLYKHWCLWLNGSRSWNIELGYRTETAEPNYN